MQPSGINFTFKEEKFSKENNGNLKKKEQSKNEELKTKFIFNFPEIKQKPKENATKPAFAKSQALKEVDINKEFLTTNNLSYIIRAHECVLDGFERFAGGLLFTVFSATDYCGKHKNAGAILFLTKNFKRHTPYKIRICRFI